MSYPCRLSVLVVLLAGSSGCGSAESGRDALGLNESSATADESPSRPAGLVDSELPPASPVGAETCAVERIMLRETRRPIDIILVLDNSVSMASELDAVERNINESFADILARSGADYRVILISRHRTAPRTQSDEAKTAICIAGPLSSLDACPASRPGASDRFFHYGVSIDSNDSLDQILATFATPDPLYRETRVGWSEWLRLGSRKIFLELTDDDALSSAEAFLEQLVALAPEHFGTSPEQTTFAFHSIVGVAEREPAGTAYPPGEPIVTTRCSSEQRAAPSSGYTYQRLSRLTGGLRYPLCQLDDYDAIFEAIARDSVSRSGLGCSFPVPEAPPGKRLDLDRIALLRGDSTEAPVPFAAVESLEACQSDAFYVKDATIELCPELCEALLDGPTATVSAVFDCSAYVALR